MRSQCSSKSHAIQGCVAGNIGKLCSLSLTAWLMQQLCASPAAQATTAPVPTHDPMVGVHIRKVVCSEQKAAVGHLLDVAFLLNLVHACFKMVVSCCRCQIEALSGTRDIIQREQKQLTAELANLKAFLVRLSKQLMQACMPLPPMLRNLLDVMSPQPVGQQAGAESSTWWVCRPSHHNTHLLFVADTASGHQACVLKLYTDQEAEAVSRCKVLQQHPLMRPLPCC
jgi:hypothetical protein